MSSANGETPVGDRSLGELVATVSQDLSLLVHDEIALAKAELTTEAKRVGLAAGLLGTAGALGAFAAIFLGIAAAFGISALGISLGYGFLCVGGFGLIVAGGLGSIGLRKVVQVGKPERTIRTVQDSLTWARHPTVAPDPELEVLKARHHD
jgi:hypothetical protein